jgi:hypothetical protein
MPQHLEYSYNAYAESIRAMMIALAQKLDARHHEALPRGITQADVDAMHRIMMTIPDID